MSYEDRLNGKFCGCVFHGDSYEDCINHSGQAPCMSERETKLQRELDVATAQMQQARTDERIAMSWLSEIRYHIDESLDFPSLMKRVAEVKKTADLAETFAKAKGRFHSQQAMCDLLKHLNLPFTRPDSK